MGKIASLIFWAGTIATCFVFAYILAAAITAPDPYDYRTDVSTVEMYSLHDELSVRGSFCLGSGNLKGEMVYVTYISSGGGGIRQQTYPTADVTIYEDAPDTPHITTYEAVKYDTRTNRTVNRVWYERPKYEFHVPPGTVIREFQLGG